ncbi:DUF72 domain-containing protein [bacterium]|nr:DUF72 domain-containing protein [bacterium]MBU1025818.1 DUF72 domain-containing protein [bacterium]
MEDNIYIGTSGYSYDDWKEIFYPEKMNRKEFLSYYSKFFSTIEINFTYYQMPFARTIEALIRKSEGNLRFVVKAHQSLTHERIEDESTYVAFQNAMAPLENEKVLSCILAQFPFSFKRNPQNMDFLKRFKKRMNRYPLVVEFRHASWVNKDVLEFLSDNNIGFCCVDEPKLPGLVPKVLTSTNDIGYIRFHGRNKETWWNYSDQSERYDYLYHKRELGDWARRLREFKGTVNELYVFFNNHPRAQAVKNAFMLKQYFGDEVDYSQHPVLFQPELDMLAQPEGEDVEKP